MTLRHRLQAEEEQLLDPVCAATFDGVWRWPSGGDAIPRPAPVITTFVILHTKPGGMIV